MSCGSAAAKMLPPYVVYKAECLCENCVHGGPAGTRYNRSKSGWFDSVCSTDWFETTFLPAARKLSGTKVIIGDNLSSHFTPEVLQLAARHDISFVCIPKNSKVEFLGIQTI